MTSQRARVACLTVVGMLAVLGCGSTAQVRTTLQSNTGQVGSGGLGDGTGGSGSGSSGGSTVTSGGSGSSGTTGAFGGGSSAGSTTAGGNGSTSVGGGASNTVAPGAPIKIGYLFSSDQEAVGQQLGLKGIVSGNTQAQYGAIAADINKRGGVLGRQLALIGHDMSTAGETSNPATEENKACVDFVQDKHVFAVLASGYAYLSPCLAKAGIPSIGGGGFDDPSTIDSQLLYDGGGMLANILAQAFVDRLAAQGYFTGWNTVTGTPGPAPVKVGLIYQDLPLYRYYFTQVKKHLAAHGIIVNPSDEFIYSPTVDGVASQSQAAVLKFSSDGVTHVFGAALLFFKDAQNQKYHPRYGLDSVAPPALLTANVGADQLHGALGIGWRPTWDVNQAQDPGPVSPLATRCTNLMRAAGEDVSTRTVLFLSHTECEQLWSLAAAFTKGGAVSVPALRAGFNALGTPSPVVSFGERWAPDRHASNTTVADLGYHDDCTCFAYTTTRTSF